MSSKRDSCFLMNALDGKKYVLPYDKKFDIGRSACCSIVIDRRYEEVVSCHHCLIRYDKNNNNFMIYKYDRSLDTYVDCQKLQKGRPAVLQHGNLISFGSPNRKWCFIFKFVSTFPNDGKKSKSDDKNKQEDTVSVIKIGNENYKKSLSKLYSEVINLKDENRITIVKIKTEMSDFQKIIDETIDRTNKLVTVNNVNYITVVKQKDIIDELNKKVSEYYGTLMIQKERLDNKDELQKSSTDLFKRQINDLLEYYLQCPVCAKVLFKITNFEKSSQMLCQHIHCVKRSPYTVLLVCLFVIGIILAIIYHE